MRTIPYNNIGNRYSLSFNIDKEIVAGYDISEVNIVIYRQLTQGINRIIKIVYSSNSVNRPIEITEGENKYVYTIYNFMKDQNLNWLEIPWSIMVEWKSDDKDVISAVIPNAVLFIKQEAPVEQEISIVWDFYKINGKIEISSPYDEVFDESKYKMFLHSVFGDSYQNVEQELITYSEFKAIKTKVLKYYYVSKDSDARRLWRIYFSNVAIFEFKSSNIIAFPRVFPYIFGTNLLT